MACPAIPPIPIWLNVFAAPASAAGALPRRSASVSGDVIATERISGAATVQFDGTDSPPIVFASPRPADIVGAGTPPGGRL